MEKGDFATAKECFKAAGTLRNYAQNGGIKNYDNVLVGELQCYHACEQFDIAGDAGGRYADSIIKYPHFTHAEVQAILEVI